MVRVSTKLQAVESQQGKLVTESHAVSSNEQVVLLHTGMELAPFLAQVIRVKFRMEPWEVNRAKFKWKAGAVVTVITVTVGMESKVVASLRVFEQWHGILVEMFIH